ncbi:MAG: hypothetical protein KDK37_03595 [Leptospiraceae bacterium]|nr:hypothetical protein [Leptospiraceae bacterium]MCB1303328.1 hypothetical protein [Leptospiraceae bacterium]
MSNAVILFLALYGFLIAERLLELVRARRNEELARQEGGQEFDALGYRWIVLMHVCWLIALPLEFYFIGGLPRIWIWILALVVLVEIMRLWTLYSLGRYWNTKVIVIPGMKPVKRGPYRWLRHPNYLVVVAELLFIPLLFGCYFTCIFFSLLNLVVLARRIRIEEKAWERNGSL